MSARFFSAAPITGSQLVLGGPEAHHLLHVMRASVGQRVTLFDDSGAEFAAEVAGLGRAEVELRILDRRTVDRELPLALVVGVSLPKGDRQKWLVEKLTELGVTTLVPLITERGVAQPTAGAIERLERTVVEACKQCGRNRLMQIAKPQAWSEWIAQSANSNDSCCLIAHPGGTSIGILNLTAPLPIQLSIGPEGGFADAEVAAAIAAGWQGVDLGPRLLRVETAAMALAAAVVARMPAT